MTDDPKIEAGQIIILSTGEYYDQLKSQRLVRAKASFYPKHLSRIYLDARDPERAKQLESDDVFDWLVEVGLVEELPLITLNFPGGYLSESTEVYFNSWTPQNAKAEDPASPPTEPKA